MAGYNKFKQFYKTNFKVILKYVKILILFGILITIFKYLPLNKKQTPIDSHTTQTETIQEPIQEKDTDNIAKPPLPSSDLDSLGITMINPTVLGGKFWYSNWSDGHQRSLASGKRDPIDSNFIARGNGKVNISGDGIAYMSGTSPRMYIYNPKKDTKWNNVEVTVYSMRVSETGVKSSQGIVIGARSEHQDATLDNPCLGRTYYGRLLYDGRAVFQKEVIHEGAYSINKPTENNKADWSLYNNQFPKHTWIGVKFIVRTNPDRKSVKLELYRDLTDGKNGGNWVKVADYMDSGDWSQTDSGADVQSKCGYTAGKILLDPGTSIFIRNDEVGEAQYKKFSIREI